MKKLFTIIGIGFALCTQAQVQRAIIVEHYTNTYCSTCASRNPGFYTNLNNFPQVIHIAYHPSSPYPSCPFSQANIPGNNARADFYGVFGQTPRLVVNGNVVGPFTDYSSPAIFTPFEAGLSDYSISDILLPEADSFAYTCIIKRVSGSSLDTLSYYAAMVEDQINFAANNGETLHRDVFRKAFFGNNPIALISLIAGDSIVLRAKVAKTDEPSPNTFSAIIILSDQNKIVVQASKKQQGIFTAIREPLSNNIFEVYPNPSKGIIHLKSALLTVANLQVIDISGKIVLKKQLSPMDKSIDLSTLSAGSYYIKLISSIGIQIGKIVLQP